MASSSEYDRKFEEMKEYIPFLENMIKRLETTSTSSANPRQAQLDKIRSLRDLLLNKKNRMKMENLLKCEQVLVNLYAKVERDSLPGIQRDTLHGIQRETLPGIKKASESLFKSATSTKTDKSDLDTVRNKLKTVVGIKPLEIDPDTLPEIDRAGETEVVCTPGSKEPALFQRRPNKNSLSPSRKSLSKEGNENKSPNKTVPKRNYTRVLVSPEKSSRWWAQKEDSSDRHLFSRRSPRRSPKKTSLSDKIDKKKPPDSRGKSSKQATDFNITLNVPEDSIDSLNTGDILSRIIKCPDNDVDIDTLRDLRKQILGELKQTGASDDISDLILKSYKKKKPTNKRKEDVEEGELSDSESEAIESIYGSLVVVDKDKTNKRQSASTLADKDNQARKIQICLVINSDKDESTTEINKKTPEETDFEMFDIEEKDSKSRNVDVSRKQNDVGKKIINKSQTLSVTKQTSAKTDISKSSNNLLTIDVEDDDDKEGSNAKDCKDSDSSYIDISSSDTETRSPETKQGQGKDIPFKPNFYNSTNDEKETEKGACLTPSDDVLHQNNTETLENKKIQEIIASENVSSTADKDTNVESTIVAPGNPSLNSTESITNSSIGSTQIDIVIEKPKENVEIPLLNTASEEQTPVKNVVSEIDILQALKNEILSESIAIPGTDVTTPLLHQPKVTKVASGQEIPTKKKISIEKYKEKSMIAPKEPLFLKNPKNSKPSDISKKTSLKLTEQEQQRFNFLPLPLDDSSDEEGDKNCLDDIYKDLAPKSPENNDEITAGTSVPVIIPVDPIKPTMINSSRADIDMRTPLLSPNMSKPVPPLPVPPPSIFLPLMINSPLHESGSDKRNESRRVPLLDPRVRRDNNKLPCKDSPSHGTNLDRTLRQSGNFPIGPNSTPIMTPSRQFEFDENSSQKHVYAPFPAFDHPSDHRDQALQKDVQGPRWETNSDPATETRRSRWGLWNDIDLRGDKNQSKKWDDRDTRGRSSRDGPDFQKSRYDSDKFQTSSRTDIYSHEKREEYSYSRMDCPRTPVHSFGRSDCPTTPTPSFGRIEASTNAFSRSDCSSTPIHPFGNTDCPSTPIHPFGRSDCPSTPSHPFGSSDCPTTPIHPFGRADCPTTPSHPFSRTDCPLTPSHVFGRSEMPMTPNHPFGRSDIPLTPSHPFGRSEASMTPSHSFGRNDAGVTPSQPFGRSDHHQNSALKAVKDPRLNRNTDYETNSRKFDENRERGHYKDRRTSVHTNIPYNDSESYKTYRERNERSRYEHTGRQNRERSPGREPSVGHILPRDYESDRFYSRDRIGSKSSDYRRGVDKESRNYREVVSRGEYQRSQSVGRTAPTDERYLRASSRGPSIDRNFNKLGNDNTLSVKPQSGKSFIIDTSVNSTFQEFLNGKGLQVFDYSFDSRRCRASSVGRTLTRDSRVNRNFREGSVGRIQSKPSYSAAEDTSGYKRMVNFVRARSMGRDIADKPEKSFKEIKADLKSYKMNYTPKSIMPSKNSNYCDPRSKKEQYLKQMEKKTSPKKYSPRKNNRDPRMQRDQFSGRSKSKYEERKKSYGIVYSSDNIAKGTILGSGYGVKNYKIPKIKKPAAEIVVEDASISKVNKAKSVVDNISSESKAKDVKNDKNNKDIPSKVKSDLKKSAIEIGRKTLTENKTETKINPMDNVSKRLTRRSKLGNDLVSDKQTFVNKKKVKKHIIDSDSENEIVSIDNEKSTDSKESSKTEPKKEKSADKIEDSAFNSNFDIDDLEIFPDNINSDPVLENISSLIADLDNDIDTSKDDFTKDNMSFDKMFDNIKSPEENMDESLTDITEVLKDLDSTAVGCQEKGSYRNGNSLTNEIKEKLSNQTIQGTEKSEICKQGSKTVCSENENSANEFIVEQKDPAKNPSNTGSNISTKSSLQNAPQNSQLLDKVVLNSDYEVVSTTEVEKLTSMKSGEIDVDQPSTPDSTLNISQAIDNKSCNEEGMPDSTNEKNEMNSDVSSTRNHPESSTKDAVNTFQNENPVNSLANLFSMLQDKSKIKELLSMFEKNQSSETEKLIKKLEKLSEIVSENDDTNDGIEDKVSERTDTNVEGSVETSTPGLVEKSIVYEEAKSEVSCDPKCTVTIEKKVEKVVTPKETELPVDNSKNNKLAEMDDKSIGKYVENEIPCSTNVEDSETQAKKVNEQTTPLKKIKKSPVKRNKRKGKWKSVKKPSLPGKRVTRSGAANTPAERPKKPSRELKLLQESIKEMFIKEDILKSTGIRMCRLAKLVEKNQNQEEEINDSHTIEPKPLVVLEKIKEDKSVDKIQTPKLRKKPGPKPKVQQNEEENRDDQSKNMKIVTPPKYKPGPKSKTKKFQTDLDPYSFDDSVSEATTAQTSEHENESDTENDSIASSKSFGSSEALADLKKKPKRKRGAWQSGIIKKRRKKIDPKPAEPLSDDTIFSPKKDITIPDMNCFTDKTYCFLKNVSEYSCRLCEYKGPEIVKHYKTDHPHTEIPLSRMCPLVAREAVEQCEDVNFQTISKMPTERYICRFCFNDFGSKRNVLEEFFWHVVSMHTGEYKSLCSECVNVTRCPFNLDIPPPPKDLKGQLIGYICGKCNFTQISLENLKLHVIVRHNDEQTAVYMINLAVMSNKTIKSLMKRCNVKEQARVLRSSRSNLSVNETEASDRSEANDDDTCNKNRASKVPVHAKLAFENDDSDIKMEREDDNYDCDDNEENTHSDTEQGSQSSDILDIAHFKLCFGNSGSKEYVCCINGKDNHYRTNLLISMKRHVQTKHVEIWDGYCYVCKVIVMPQGEHGFKDCLQHMLDNHMDNFPIIEEPSEKRQVKATPTPELILDNTPAEKTTTPNSYINVRSLTELLTEDEARQKKPESLPKIQSVISLGDTICESLGPSQVTTETTVESNTKPVFKSPTCNEKATRKPEEPYKFEEHQAEVMAKKHLVILQSMLIEEKLVKIFKCAGRFCSFTTDSADAALLHASTHQRLGGENTMLCSYCDYNCKGNAIDLVMHVFKIHGCCTFVCAHCFYRAVASQLVLAHILRVHGESGAKVLETATVTPVVDDPADVLPREVAVEHYTCNDPNCKFKTYTSGKFMDHLITKHSPPFLCRKCAFETNHPKELIHHCRTHGLKLYQCTWCVDGGDNEADFLAHSSARHPSRRPQAYLRVITNSTNKDGASKTMVLPLVKLNQSSVPTQIITSQGYAVDPAREAEKALDMEKLITAMPFLTNETTKEYSQTPEKVAPSHESPQIPTENEIGVVEMVSEPPRLKTPPPLTSVQEQNDASILTPILKPKIEPIDEIPTKTQNPTVICLDSDEEDSTDTRDKQNVIDLSDEDPSSTSTYTHKPKKMGTLELFKCYKCKVTFKSPHGFKRHLNTCFAGQNNYVCAHCTYTVTDLDKLCHHYTLDHSMAPDTRKPMYVCGICNRTDKYVGVIKNHVKKDHGLSNLTVSIKTGEDDIDHYIVNGTAKAKPGPKRKLSGSITPESAPKRVRYGAQDLHKLPQKPILDDLAYCSECEFSTKVRLNLVRHIQQHADNQLVPQTAPVNPVPHLETNEKHFDKMINLASSSLELARVEKPTPSVTLHIPPEVESRYPKYVPDRQRLTCGAKDCSYISVDEAMLKCHWETLHAGSNDFHCVHCPPYQYLDTSIPLTASRIISHLKMHDIRLYACSSCIYYHYRKQVLEKHVAEIHKGSGQVMIVREESTNIAPVTSSQTMNAAPTMDLKPWKCGLCAFKSMLRPEVIDHCSKNHSTKMQYKCPVCPFRGSSLENVTKHKGNSHPENNEDVFYYYYREGTIPDEPDGTPRWVKQRLKLGNPDPVTEVKAENINVHVDNTAMQPILPATPTINLSIVKEEVIDHDEDSLETLCRKFGEICDPNGLKYKCPLCKLVMEDTKDAMQSHLYEELKYRKWACSVCCYKAFHKTGLNEHMITEHRQHNVVEPIELPENTSVERWVSKVLDHQASIIESNKANIDKQRIQVDMRSNVTPTPQKPFEKPPEIPSKINKNDTDNLIQAFGEFGAPNSINFCCPKCDYTTEDEGAMKNHLEIELNKIRWRCSCCWKNSQNYHEAQLHSKTCTSSLPGQASRPIEAIRDPLVRAAWLAAVIRTQKQGMKKLPEPEPQHEKDNITGTLENSLLVVRYEEHVPTPEEEMINRRKRPATPAANSAASPDSDEERLVIDELTAEDGETHRNKDGVKKCSICSWSTKYSQQLYDHVLRHYDLRPLTCNYCNKTIIRRLIDSHTLKEHPNMPRSYSKTKIPSGPPVVLDVPTVYRKRYRSTSTSNEESQGKTPQSKEEVKKDDVPKLICLVCENAVSETEIDTHVHDKATYFSKKGEVVVKCCICLSLFPNIDLMQEHNNQNHPNIPINYAYFKLNHHTRDILQCGHCGKRFKYFGDLKSHHNIVHSALQLKYESRPYYPGAYDFELGTEFGGESSKSSEIKNQVEEADKIDKNKTMTKH